ncbi:hypothetical protein PV327_001964 [Microctonus hyperodae]|uniref:SET domain-containing protein n=1 Tax=Microctonus hyperodae TaxID=165561 RepID=A0AA39FER4_MICHY|nr:hypothetical protein PV327_001964 [Microctonus hyperodae]
MDEIIRILTRCHIQENNFKIKGKSYDISSAKNNEERVKIALQYLSSNENPIDFHRRSKQNKSTAKVSEYIEEGNKAYQSQLWVDAIEKYTHAVIYAEINSKELARAYGNRSAALYDAGLYDDSLIDIERALKIGYNDNTKAKLYTRRAKCIFSLEKKMTPEVKKAIADARKWLENMNENNKKLLKNILDEFPKNLLIKKSTAKVNYSKIMPKIPNNNPKILEASGAVTLKYSKKYGRLVEATKDIDAGDVIMVQKCYATCTDRNFYYKRCAHCGNVVFSDPILKCFTNNVFDPTKYASVYSLCQKTTVLFEEALFAALIVHSLAATTEIFGKKITTFKELLENKWTKFMGGLILTNYRIVFMNGAQLKKTHTLHMDTFWCLFNHSCDPSTLSMISGGVRALIACQRIKKGEQVFVSYGPVYGTSDTNERRKHYKAFNFWCECTACVRNWGPNTYLTFPYGVTGDTLKRPEIKKRVSFLSNYDIPKMNEADIDNKLKMIQYTYYLLNFFQKFHGYPTKEMFDFKNCLHTVIDSIF